MLRLIGSLSCRFEEVVAFFIGEMIADVADRLPKLIVGSGGSFSDQRPGLVPPLMM
ncbi:MAG TPA: hypothetical protein PLI43_12450 [Albidovulum sp.]|uniref:hypothetical protein n=1 Tax=Albidovulum sp. TaxID=1872424 RepID=UPI002B6DFF85|nr:hypothetical protein [Albidovulum sp.]